MGFKPSLQATAALAALSILFAWLGTWQLQRAGQKQAVITDFDSAPRITALAMPAPGQRFARLTLAGAFDRERHTLMDNRVFNGRAGVHVLTPFETEDGATVLVNRGWLPMPPDRRSLPGVQTAPGALQISGILDHLAPPGRQLGQSDRMFSDSWPQLTTYPEIDDIATALGTDLYPLVLLLDADSQGGFAGRDWQPVYMTPDRHRGCAVQWLALAATVLAAWVFVGIRRGRLLNNGRPQ